MTKIICSPGSYIQGAGEFKNLASYYDQLGSKGAYIICANFVYNHYREDIVSSFEEAGTPYQLVRFGGECCMEEVDLHRSQLGECDVIIGIGGGKALDTSKAVAYYEGLPVIIAPSAASSDAPCSRLSVLYTQSGEFDRYLPLPKNPDIVVMDTKVIAEAPVRTLMAGIGDAMATYYEAAACVQSDAVTMAGGHVTKTAFAIATLCRDVLLADGLKAKAACEAKVITPALENIVEANTYLSGVGFESSGLAASHAIHNGLTTLEETHKFMHGEKVTFGLTCQLILEDRSTEEFNQIVGFCRQCGLPTTMEDLGIQDVSDERLLEAATLACAPTDTMGNMPFEVTPQDIVWAMKATSKVANL